MDTIRFIEKTLKQFGLADKEVKIVIILFGLGRTTVSALSRSAGLPRTTLYPLLEHLERRKLIHKIRVYNHNEWEAINPKAFYQIMKDGVDDLKDSLPMLEKMYSSLAEQSRFPEIIYYRSREGIKKAYESIFGLKPTERAYFIEGNRSVETKVKFFKKNYILDWQETFKKKGIILESVIGEQSLEILHKMDKEILQAHAGRMVIVSVLPDSLMDFDADIISFKDTVVIVIVSKDIAVFMHSREAAEAFKNLFLIARQVGKKVDLNVYIKNLLEEKKNL